MIKRCLPISLFLLLSCSASLKTQNNKTEFEANLLLHTGNDTAVVANPGKIVVNGKNFTFSAGENTLSTSEAPLLRATSLIIPISSIKEIELLDQSLNGQQRFRFKLGDNFMQFSAVEAKLIVDYIIKLKQ